MSDNLDKWKSILSQLEVDLLLFAGQNIKCPDSLLILESKNLQNFLEDNNFDFFQDSLSTLNQSQIDQFQSETKITLPQKYQEFCQVFGSGGFEPSECGIECPDIYNSQEQIRLNNYLLEVCRDGTEWSQPDIELLNSSFLFGKGQDEVFFIFDLRSYDQQDRSYDIYGIEGGNGITFYLGRNFFEFVVDICIGKKLKTDFPELITTIFNEAEEENYNRATKTFFPRPIMEKMKEI